MKTLIVYYSFTHNNDLLARFLQERLNCDILRIEEVKKRTGFTILLDLLFNRKPAIKDTYPTGKNYDHHIFIAPVWGGKIASPLKTFLLRQKDSIKHYSFITVCGGSAGQKKKIFDQLKTILQRNPKKVTELWVNDLLTEDKKDTIKYTSGYRLQPKDLEHFTAKIDDFLGTHEAVLAH